MIRLLPLCLFTVWSFMIVAQNSQNNYKIKVNEDVIAVNHPNYQVVFTPNGFDFFSKSNNIIWNWELNELQGGKAGAMPPVWLKGNPYDTIQYLRGNVIEQYLLKEQNIEQQFVVQNPVEKDLKITGSIKTNGQFQEHKAHWSWADSSGGVRIGSLRVFDAEQHTIPAHFDVCANFTEISIAASDLTNAKFPITLDPEIGNDFAISTANITNQVQYASVAYNSAKQEYLAVWVGTYNVSGLDVAEPEIWGQRINATNGALVGSNFKISDMGPNNQSSYGASAPEVAYNSVNNTYLVVWYGDDDTSPLVINEAEIFGQRLNANGTEIGTNDFRISSMGNDNENNPDVRKEYDAKFPALTYNATSNEFLVVWYGDDVVDDDIEIWGQRLNANTGAKIGSDFRISTINLNSATHVNDDPSVTWNSTNNQYLVTWHAGNYNTKIYEIIGQRVSATGTLTGNNFTISSSNGGAREAAVAYNPNNSEYLVIWASNEGNSEYRIHGQRINATGTAVGNNFLISSNGEDVIGYLDTHVSAVAYDANKNEFVVIWSGDAGTNNYQIYSNFVPGGTSATSGNALRLSTAGGHQDSPPSPALALNTTTLQCLAVWTGNGEIVGQRFNSNNDPVPVELLYFDAFQDKQGIRLVWETASEIDNQGFEIQRLNVDGLTWEVIGFVHGAGNSVEKIKYQFLDYTPESQLNYYRLRQIDFDGKYEFSEIVAVKNEKSLHWKIYPNPVIDFMYFEHPEEENTYQIKIWNTQGQLISNFYSVSNVFNFEKLIPGLYNIQIIGEKQQFAGSFIKK